MALKIYFSVFHRKHLCHLKYPSVIIVGRKHWHGLRISMATNIFFWHKTKQPEKNYYFLKSEHCRKWRQKSTLRNVVVAFNYHILCLKLSLKHFMQEGFDFAQIFLWCFEIVHSCLSVPNLKNLQKKIITRYLYNIQCNVLYLSLLVTIFFLSKRTI